jgi:hypothetical protein
LIVKAHNESQREKVTLESFRKEGPPSFAGNPKIKGTGGNTKFEKDDFTESRTGMYFREG